MNTLAGCSKEETGSDRTGEESESEVAGGEVSCETWNHQRLPGRGGCSERKLRKD